MARYSHICSFLLLILCFVLTGVFAFSARVSISIQQWTGFHPLSIVLCLTLGAFVLAFLGLLAIHNWLSALRSWITLILSAVLTVCLALVLLVGKLFG